jgi:hypothetical protein
MKDVRNAYKPAVEKHKGKRIIRIPRRIWKNKNNSDLKGLGCEIVDWVQLPQTSVFL